LDGRILSLRNTPSRGLISLLGVILFVVCGWASDAPWMGKPYDQWNDKDLERVFTDSPWTRTMTITRTWLPISSKDLPDKPLDGGVKKLPNELERSGETSVGGELNFNIYWASSRVMRAASARKAALHGGSKDVDVARYATEPQDEIQIVVQSEDMAPFVRKDENFFQANAFLRLRKLKERISPTHVRYERGESGLTVTAAIFFFPKKTSSGDFVIAADEKNVEFNCKIEGSTLRVSFEPNKMVDRNGPAL
jgi:hypothetical protein